MLVQATGPENAFWSGTCWSRAKPIRSASVLSNSGERWRITAKAIPVSAGIASTYFASVV